jgi:PAS domain S-box-containing protein
MPLNTAVQQNKTCSMQAPPQEEEADMPPKKNVAIPSLDEAMSLKTRKAPAQEEEEAHMASPRKHVAISPPEEEMHMKMEAMFLSALDPILQMDSNGTIQMFNPACGRMFKYATGEMIGRSFSMLVPECNDTLTHYLGGEKYMRNLRGRRSDGSTFPLFLSLSEATVSGEKIFSAIIRDATDEEEIQLKMETERKKTEFMIESAVDPIVQIDSKGVIHSVNSSCCEVFMYKEGEMLGKHLSMLMPEPDGTNHASYVDNYLKNGVMKDMGTGCRLRGRRSDSTTFAVYLRLSESKGGDQVFFTGIFRDLSAEEQEREHVISLIESAVDPIVQIDTKGTILTTNNACRRIFKYQEGEMVGNNVSMLMTTPHAESHDSYLSNFLETGIKKVMGAGRRVPCRKSDGTTFPAFLTLSECKKGDRIIFTGILRDLSAEEQERARMVSMVETATDPIVQIDAKGIMQTVNPACCRVFMYKDEELVGSNVSMLMHQPHTSNHDNYIRNYMKTGEKKVMGKGRKVQGRRSDGTNLVLFLTVSEAKIGEDVFFTAILRDLTVEEQERERMLSMITSAVDPIVQINSQGIIQTVNPACCRVFLYTERQLLGKNVSTIMPSPHAHRHDEYINRYMKTGVKKLLGKGRKLLGRRRDGSMFAMFLSLSEAKVGDEVFFTGILRDLQSFHDSPSHW